MGPAHGVMYFRALGNFCGHLQRKINSRQYCDKYLTHPRNSPRLHFLLSFNTDYGSSEPLKTLVMLCYVISSQVFHSKGKTLHFHISCPDFCSPPAASTLNPIHLNHLIVSLPVSLDLD